MVSESLGQVKFRLTEKAVVALCSQKTNNSNRAVRTGAR